MGRLVQCGLSKAKREFQQKEASSTFMFDKVKKVKQDPTGSMRCTSKNSDLANCLCAIFPFLGVTGKVLFVDLHAVN